MAGKDPTHELADKAITLYNERKRGTSGSKEKPNPISLTEAVWIILRQRWPSDESVQRRHFSTVMERINHLNLERRIGEGRRAPDTPKPKPELKKARPAVQTEFPGIRDYAPDPNDSERDYLGHGDVPLGRSRVRK